MSNPIKNFINLLQDGPLTKKLRKRRFELFKSFIAGIEKPINILDVGGTGIFWEDMNFHKERDIRILLLNIVHTEVHSENLKSIIGDATDMHQFADNHFDIVFSNSVIEHVGDYDNQCKMANEVQRVGKKYFVQTPNYYFPIEPHFFIPFFQFFPLWLKVWLLTHFSLGWYHKYSIKDEAVEKIKSIQLLKKRDLEKMFPNATLYKENFLGMTKSFILYGSSENK